MKFHRVLPGVAVRPPGENRHALVQHPPLPVQKRPQNQLSVGCLLQRPPTFGLEHLPRHLGAALTGQA